MKRKGLILTALSVAAILMLTACTSSDSGEEKPLQSTSKETQGERTQDNGTQDNGTQDKETQDEETQQHTESQTDQKKEENVPDEPKDKSTEIQEDIWTGSYTGDQEDVTLKMNDDGSLTFTFAQSGISGTAQINGSEAVYSGDDDHILTFQKEEGLLKITVSHADGYDTSESPLNGTFIPSY